MEIVHVREFDTIGIILDKGKNPNGAKWYRTDSDGVRESDELEFISADMALNLIATGTCIAPSTKRLIFGDRRTWALKWNQGMSVLKNGKKVFVKIVDRPIFFPAHGISAICSERYSVEFPGYGISKGVNTLGECFEAIEIVLAYGAPKELR